MKGSHRYGFCVGIRPRECPSGTKIMIICEWVLLDEFFFVKGLEKGGGGMGLCLQLLII